MLRSLMSALLVCTFASIVIAADKTPAELAIGKAIAVLEAEREKAEDPLERAKIDKAVRELEVLMDDPDADSKPNSAKSSAIKFVVKPAVLKKKFGGKSVFNAKTGELTLTYDFSQKGQLADFETKSVKAPIAQGTVLIDGSETLTHIAKFKSVSVSTNMSFKSMRGCGISSTGGTKFYTGGQFLDTIYLAVDGSELAAGVVAANRRTGTVPLALTISPSAASVRFAEDRLVVKIAKNAVPGHEEVHQLVFEGGVEGAGFSNIIIAGIPDPEWFKQFVGE
jgi:hypothetical protein